MRRLVGLVIFVLVVYHPTKLPFEKDLKKRIAP